MELVSNALETVSETLDTSFILTCLIAQEDFVMSLHDV
jgi:hypothetical protein